MCYISGLVNVITAEYGVQKPLTPLKKSKETVQRWMSDVLCHVQKFWDPFSLWNKQWWGCPTWTYYSFICYPICKIISQMRCSSMAMQLHTIFLFKNFLTCIFLVSGPILWPLPSPDITLLDFFLGWYVKATGYRNPSNNWDSYYVIIIIICACTAVLIISHTRLKLFISWKFLPFLALFNLMLKLFLVTVFAYHHLLVLSTDGVCDGTIEWQVLKCGMVATSGHCYVC